MVEADPGHDLFERRGRNLVLTEAGRIVPSYAEQIFRASEQPASAVGTSARLALAAQGLHTLLATAALILPTPETALRAGLDAMIEQLGIVPRFAAEADDMTMLRLLARSDVGVAVIPPIVVGDDLAAGTLNDLFRLPGITEDFCAVTIARTFPNPLLKEVPDVRPAAAGLAGRLTGQ